MLSESWRTGVAEIARFPTGCSGNRKISDALKWMLQWQCCRNPGGFRYRVPTIRMAVEAYGFNRLSSVAASPVETCMGSHLLAFHLMQPVRSTH